MSRSGWPSVLRGQLRGWGEGLGSKGSRWLAPGPSYLSGCWGTRARGRWRACGTRSRVFADPSRWLKMRLRSDTVTIRPATDSTARSHHVGKARGLLTSWHWVFRAFEFVNHFSSLSGEISDLCSSVTQVNREECSLRPTSGSLQPAWCWQGLPRVLVSSPGVE